jgi:hypothetical protein
VIGFPFKSFPSGRVLLIPGLLAITLLLAPPVIEGIRADDQKESGEEAPPEDKPPAGDKAAPGTTKTPAAGQDKTTGAKKPPAARQKAPPAKPPEPAPLRFDDDDLKAYRKPVAEEVPAEEPVAWPPAPPPKPGATGPAGPAAGKGSATPPQKGQTQTSAPVTFAPTPALLNPVRRKKPPVAPDPLAPFKQREAREQYRAGQIQGLRDEIGALEARLAYLREKRTAILAPLNFAQMPQGQTDEDRQKDASLKPKELLEQLEVEIASTEQKLEATRTTLAEIELRFGAEAGIR